MKPTYVAVLACILSAGIAFGGTLALITPKSATPSETLSKITLANRSIEPGKYLEAVIDAVPAEDNIAENSHADSQSTDESDSTSQTPPPGPIVEVARFGQKVIKRSGNYIYRSWRVDVANTTSENIDIYLEVEWLDSDGFRVDYANERRTIFPGVNALSKVEMFDQQENSRIASFRVTELRGDIAVEPTLGVVAFKDKVTKRSGNYIYHAWRVDVANNNSFPVRAYVEVEWLDADGYRIDYANEARTIPPGVSVISKIEMFDQEDNAMIKGFRVIDLRVR